MNGAKEYLDQIRLLDKRIDRKIEEKEVLKSIATSTGNFSMNQPGCFWGCRGRATMR